MRGSLPTLTAFLVILAGLLTPWPGVAVIAQDRSIRIETIKSETPNGKPAAALVINDQVVAQLAKEQRSRSPLRNISIAAALVAEAYRSNRAELTVKATDNSNRRYGLFLNGNVLLVATDMEGKAWGASPEELANTWRNNLLDAWDLAEAVPVEPTPAPAAQPVAPATAPTVTGGTFRQDTAVVRADPQLANLTISRGHTPHEPPAYTRLDGAIRDVATAQTLLEQQQLAVPRESLTFFSNKPEQVTGPQLLYHADLPAGEAARLVLHHQNKSRQTLRLFARVINTSSDPVAIHVIPGVSDPDINTFYIGFKSAERFWYNLNHNQGYVLGVPAYGQASIAVQDLPSGYTSSGYFKITNLGEVPLRLETLVLDPGDSLPAQAIHDTTGSSSSVYPAPYEMITASYEAGDPWLYLRLGEADAKSLNDATVLDGCYGMTHTYNIELYNPKEWPALVFVVLRASAGEVKGQFFIDDEYVATPLVVSGEEQLLKEVPVKPGETKLLRIKAIPLNGGFYPASIILRESRYP